MVSNFLAFEANNVGLILDLVLCLLIVLGLLLVGYKTMFTPILREILYTQDIVECGFPIIALLQVFLQTNDLGLELFIFLYNVSIDKRARGYRSLIIRATRHGEQIIATCSNIM